MPRTFSASADQLDWLRSQIASRKTYTEMAQTLGICTDTLKRLLHKHNIVSFDGAKYQVKRDADTSTWTRPCSSCKDTTPRPKWRYYCRPCALRMGLGNWDD
jgi:hypothetical protein